MTQIGLFQFCFYLLILIGLSIPLGWYMARVYENKPCGLDKLISPIEQIIYRFSSIQAQQEMNWKIYLLAMLGFNLLGLLFVYFIQRLQFFSPLNPQHFFAPPAASIARPDKAITLA